MIDVRKLQAAVGATVDGVLGRGTLTSLFRKVGASQERAEELALAANVHFAAYDILGNGLRLAHFMAQLCHESGSFKYMEEIASGQAYEGRKNWATPSPATASDTRVEAQFS